MVFCRGPKLRQLTTTFFTPASQSAQNSRRGMLLTQPEPRPDVTDVKLKPINQPLGGPPLGGQGHSATVLIPSQSIEAIVLENSSLKEDTDGLAELVLVVSRFETAKSSRETAEDLR